MSQPLYFLAGVTREQLAGDQQFETKLNRALLAERGLAGVFSDVPDQDAVAYEVHDAPDGKSGCMLYYKTATGKEPLTHQYRPSAQTWHQVGEKVYIGIENDAPPTPEDLRRKNVASGYPVEMDAGEFVVPVIRRRNGSTELPRSLVWDAAGNLIEPIKPAYQQIWERTAEVASWIFEGDWKDAYKGKALGHVVDALAINYRVGRFEQNVLRLVDIGNLFWAMAAMVDARAVDEMEEAQKKTESSPPGVNTTPGQQGE